MAGPVLVVVDGSDVGWLALAAAIDAARTDGAQLVCLTVYPPRLTRGKAAHFDPEPEALDVEFADAVLADAVARAAAAGVTAETVRRVGRPVPTIAAEAEERGAALLVVGRRPPLPGLALPDPCEQLAAATSVQVQIVDLGD